MCYLGRCSSEVCVIPGESVTLTGSWESTVVKCKPMPNVTVSVRLKSAISELRRLQKLLLSEEVDARILSDFRDALNRVRNTAWAAQQSLASKLFDKGPTDVVSLLASERIRAAYQLCRSIEEDLTSDDIQFQKGQLSELHSVAARLVEQLKTRL
jgi:hypothetical protein